MDLELVRAINYAQKLLDATIDVVGAAPECIELNQNWARDDRRTNNSVPENLH